MDKKYCIRFLPSGKEASVFHNESLLDAARKAGINMAAPCGGRGSCGKCCIIVERGRVISSEEPKEGFFLACRTYALSDLLVRVPQGSTTQTGASYKGGTTTSKIEHCGLAIDVGTSTVAAYLVDMQKKEVISHSAGYNKQAAYGADVISRMDYAKKHGIKKLHDAVIDTINGLVIDMMKENPCITIEEIWAAGNTVMTYLLMNKNPSIIKKHQDLDEYKTTFYADARSLGLSCGGMVKTLPGIAGYVGGDIIGDIISSGMHESKKTSMLIDVGTNGEVVLGNKEWFVACSTSAGPAFEGAGISCGTTASKGAIDRVEIKDKRAEYSTIGNAKATGICGSGLIDLVAQLFLQGIIDHNGKYIGNEKEYVVVPKKESATGRDIKLSEQDIRNVIYSKAAIYAGAYTLTKTGLPFDKLTRIYVAGGFGFSLNVENAITIGLLPDVPIDKYDFIGNGSLKGAFLALTDAEKRREALQTADKSTYIDLSSNKDYTREYMDATCLPHKDWTRFPSLKN